jgi:type II secretory pathway component GspD/PulD (secretin)
MTKAAINWHKYIIGILGLCLGLAFPAHAQRGGGGGGFGGGGFGGGGFGGGRSGTAGSAGTTSRQYPNNTSIGDAYFSIDPETRRVVYIADAATAASIAQVLTNLDRPKPQVLIKVVFLEVTHTDGSDIGIEGSYGTTFGNSYQNGLTTNYSVVNNQIVPTSITPGTTNPFTSLAQAFGVPGPNSTFGGANGIYTILGQDYTITLHAIAQAGKAKILSRPSILARNNQPATIQVGQQVPLINGVTYDSFGNSHNSIQYTGIGVILRVTPFITEDGLVEMIVSPQISQLDPGAGIPISANANGTGTINAPIIDIRQADTVAVTPDGQTVVIGGLMQNIKTETITKIPYLGDVPLIGSLFRRTQKADNKVELVIFLTPHIVGAPTELAALSAKQKDRSDAYKGLTEEELNKFLDQLPKDKSSPDASKKNNK